MKPEVIRNVLDKYTDLNPKFKSEIIQALEF